MSKTGNCYATRNCCALGVNTASEDCCGDRPVTTVQTALTLRDTLDAWKARWGIGRMDSAVDPGLYAIGKPDNDSPLFVSAN